MDPANIEEDNVTDIIKWIFHESTQVDQRGNVRLDRQDASSNGNQGEVWEAKLKGNLLALKPVEIGIAEEPFLIACERIRATKCFAPEESEGAVSPAGVKISFEENEAIVLHMESETDADEWCLKLSLCSHQMAQASLDEVVSEPPSEPRASPTSPSANSLPSGSTQYFLCAPVRKQHMFTVQQLMNESKLSFVIPPAMLKLFLRQSSELRDQLLQHLGGLRNLVALESLQNAVRHLNSHTETFTQAIEFLDAYSGPSFRPSLEKLRVAFTPVPTNLHVQHFQVGNTHPYRFLTSGAIAALSLRFHSGGLHKLRGRFTSGLDPQMVDHTDAKLLHSRQYTLLSTKRRIGELTRRADGEWGKGAGANKEKQTQVQENVRELYAQVKELYDSLCDLVFSFPNISNLVDAQCEGGQVQKEGGVEHLSTQLEFLDASVTSLETKVVSIESTLDAHQEPLVASARASLHATLDALLRLTESLIVAQLLGFVLALRDPDKSKLYFHMQLRYDLLLSQATTLVVTALLTWLDGLDSSGSGGGGEAAKTPIQSLPLITFFSFLSCHGDERGMLEDMLEIWASFHSSVSFRFISATSAVSQTCIPQLDSPNRMDLRVSIPLSSAMMEKLPAGLVGSEFHRVNVAFFNMGINHEAWYAAKLGGVRLEETINQSAVSQLKNLLPKLADGATNDATVVSSLFADLEQTVRENASRQNMRIFSRAAALTQALGGVMCIACKSGKDRTSMGVTLEEGRLLREQCGITQQQTSEIVDHLRLKGVRRENCRKNVGRPFYCFSTFQLNFLPREMRPPPGSFLSVIAS